MRGNWCWDEEGCRGEPGSCDYCTHVLRPWGLTQGLLQVSPSARQSGLFSCSFHPRQKLLPSPPRHCCSSASQLPWSPSCHPTISAFITLYNFFVPSEVLLPLLLLHVFHFSYHECHSHTANTRSATTFLWICLSAIFGDIPHLKRRNTEKSCIFLGVYFCLDGCQGSAYRAAEAMQIPSMHSSSFVYTIRVSGQTWALTPLQKASQKWQRLQV